VRTFVCHKSIITLAKPESQLECPIWVLGAFMLYFFNERI
jgi:hypothetical protein